MSHYCVDRDGKCPDYVCNVLKDQADSIPAQSRCVYPHTCRAQCPVAFCGDGALGLFADQVIDFGQIAKVTRSLINRIPRVVDRLGKLA